MPKEQFVSDVYDLLFEYEQMSSVMNIVKGENLNQLDQEFGMDCKLRFEVPKRNSQRILNMLRKLGNLRVQYVETI